MKTERVFASETHICTHTLDLMHHIPEDYNIEHLFREKVLPSLAISKCRTGWSVQINVEEQSGDRTSEWERGRRMEVLVQ
jgi:hypothetical protein